ncbi:MAG: peptide/nickel transport system permease protein, partial [Gammaproteobacteria bacterium]
MTTVILWTDILIYALVVAISFFFWNLRKDLITRERWSQVFSSRLGMVSFVVIAFYILVALLDSLHFRDSLESVEGQASDKVYYGNNVRSALDTVLGDMSTVHERTYSAPFALNSFEKVNLVDDQGVSYRDFPALEHAGIHLESPDDKIGDVVVQSLIGLLIGLGFSVLLVGPQWWLTRHSELPWQSAWIAQVVIICLVAWMIRVGNLYHILGTDLAGNDVLYKSIKGIRTGVLLGSLATLIMLPIAVSLGIAAGYFKGWVDDLVQYLYTTLSSIPGVLLIAASVLMFQVYIDLNPDMFEVGLEKADAKFLALCFILGVTSWATLCRLVRAETLKISQLDYVQAAHAFGVSHGRIIRRHILPNITHIILITFVLEFSALVLAEAVLSYIGVGIDPAMASWGNIINSARTELSRDPAVWWTLTGAFCFMFLL